MRETEGDKHEPEGERAKHERKLSTRRRANLSTRDS